MPSVRGARAGAVACSHSSTLNPMTASRKTALRYVSGDRLPCDDDDEAASIAALRFS